MTARTFVPDPNPNGLQVYDLVTIQKIGDDSDPTGWWIETKTTCGHTIVVGSPESLKSEEYQVVIYAPDGHVLRMYNGGEGSDAERVFKFGYESYLYALDESRKTSDATRTR